MGLEQKLEMAISHIGEGIGMNPPAGLEMLLGTDAWRMGSAMWATYGIGSTWPDQHSVGRLPLGLQGS